MKRRRIASIFHRILPLALLVALPSGARPVTTSGSSTLQVFAAASLSDAFSEIARKLEQQRPGLTVRINFAGSQQLATQIEQGAMADVFASADQRWMDYAKERELLLGEPTTFANNTLVVIVPRTNPARIHRLQDLSRGGVKLVLAADAVPVGRYSRIMLRNLGRDPAFAVDFVPRTLRNVVSEEENVKSVVGKVQLGEADAGIVYRSDVTPTVARYLHVLAIPDSANVIASYPIAQVKDSREPEAGKAFVDLVLSPGGQQILERWNLIPVTPPRR